MKTGATDDSKDFLRQGLSIADDIVDEIRRSLEENESLDVYTLDKYDKVLERLSVKINQIKTEIDYI